MEGVSWHGRRDRAWIYKGNQLSARFWGEGGGGRLRLGIGSRGRGIYRLLFALWFGVSDVLLVGALDVLFCEPAEGGAFFGGRVLDLDFKLRKRN